MSDDGSLGPAMVIALLVGLMTTMALGAKLLIIVLTAVLVLVQS